MKQVGRWDTLPKDKTFLEGCLDVLPELTHTAIKYRNKNRIPEAEEGYLYSYNGISNFTCIKKFISSYFQNPQFYGDLYLKAHGDNQDAYDGIRNFFPSIPKAGKEFFDIIGGDKPFNKIYPLQETYNDVINEANNATTMFLDAVKKENYQKLEHYIDNLGVNPSWRQTIYGDGEPLSLACNKGNPRMFNFLISKGAQLGDMLGENRLLKAWKDKDAAWLEALANAKANPKETVYFILNLYKLEGSDTGYVAGELQDVFHEVFMANVNSTLTQVAPIYINNPEIGKCYIDSIGGLPVLVKAQDESITLTKFINHYWDFTTVLYQHYMHCPGGIFDPFTDYSDSICEKLSQLIALQPAYRKTIIRILDDLKVSRDRWREIIPDLDTITSLSFVDEGNQRLDNIIAKLSTTMEK